MAGRRIEEVGEFGLIERIARRARRLPRGAVALGIGDDAALLRPRRGEELAVTTDALVEGVHFRLDEESARTAGRRALVANLSDLAAMGARPLAFTLSLAAPGATPLRTAMGLVEGLLAEAGRYGCPLAGGNVTRAGEIALHVTALGAVPRGRALTRAGARPGDRLFVTGRLGAAALERARGRVRRVPEPRLAAGRALARSRLARAAIDVSDGLLADLGHLLRASGVGATVDPARVPRPPGLAAAAARLDLDPDALALAGGEDFELVFAARPSGPGAAAWSRRLGLPVAEIGRATRRRGLRLEGGGPAPAGGWRHF